MKRKLIPLITALACAVSCAFAFAACDSGDAHKHRWSADWQSDETHHWHNCTADGCTVTDNAQKDGYAAHDFTDGNCVCGKQKPAVNEPVVYTVSENEWNKAFNYRYKNLTYKFKTEGSGEHDYEIAVKLTEDGSLHQSAGAGWGERFHIVQEDKSVWSYWYDGSESKWYCNQTAYDNLSEYEKGSYCDDTGALDVYIKNVLLYETFKFDETENVYRRTVTQEIPEDAGGGTGITDISVRFGNGKVVSVTCTSKRIKDGVTTPVGGTSSWTFYDYGTTVITPPANYTISNH